MRCQPRVMKRDPAGHQDVPRLSTSARTKLLVSLGAAIVGGAAAARVGVGRAAPLIGWDILAVVFCAWMWSTVWRLDAKSTASHAQRESPGRDLADVVLLGAAVASLIAVGVVLIGAGHANGSLKYLQAGFALVSVSVSWTLVHTVQHPDRPANAPRPDWSAPPRPPSSACVCGMRPQRQTPSHESWGQPQGHVPIAAGLELTLTGFGGPVREYQCPGDPWWPKPVESGGISPASWRPPGGRPPTKARRDYATHRHFRDTEGGPVSGLSDSNNGEVHRRGASRLR